MHGYDLQQVIKFIDDATQLYIDSRTSVDTHSAIWVAQMQFDAVSMGYPSARAKQLAELRKQLGGSAPPPPPPPPPTTVPHWPSVLGGDYHAWFLKLVAGRPYAQQTLQDLWDEGAFPSANVVLSPRNRDNELTKIGLPVPSHLGDRTWVRVFGVEKPWPWLVQ